MTSKANRITQIKKSLKELDKLKNPNSRFPSEGDLNNFEIGVSQQYLLWELQELEKNV